MPGTNTSALPFTVFKVIGSSDAQPLVQKLPEVSSLTVNGGTPVRLVSGFASEMDTIDGTDDVIAGICQEAGHNLTTSGTAPFGGSGVTFGKVQNQPSAVNIPVGAPFADGTLFVDIACDTTIFDGVVDTAHSLLAADVGSIFGLTKDSTTGNWFVDTTITSAGSGACVEITELIDPIGTAGGKVAFKVTRAYQQMFT